MTQSEIDHHVRAAWIRHTQWLLHERMPHFFPAPDQEVTS